MARAFYGALITDFIGSIGGLTFQHNSSGAIARSKPNFNVNPSNLQAGRELMLGYLSNVWGSLSMTDKAGWVALAAGSPHYDPWGVSKQLNGFQYFMSNNINLSITGNQFISIAPAYSLPTAPPSFTLNFTSTQIYLEFSSPVSFSPNYFALYITPPLRQSNLDSRKNSFLLDDGVWLSSTVLDITEAYIAYFNIFYSKFISSVDCTIIARCCIIDTTTGYRSMSSVASFKPVPIPVFSTVWKTDNVGVSNNDQIQLPLYYTNSYDFDVDWGDGTTDHITAYNDAATLHTFPSAGTYAINITGVCDGFRFNIFQDQLKLIEISNWGCFRPGAGGLQFFDCFNMICSAADILDFSGSPNPTAMFSNCHNFNGQLLGCDLSGQMQFTDMFSGALVFNQPLNSWNMSSAVTLDRMFAYASLFNQTLFSWDVSNVTSAVDMFAGSALSTPNYTSILMYWSKLSVQPNVVFGVGSIKYMAKAQASRDVLTSAPNNWVITDGGPI